MASKDGHATFTDAINFSYNLFQLRGIDISAAPEIILTLAILLILLVGVLLPYWRYRLLFTVLALAGLAGSLLPLGS